MCAIDGCDERMDPYRSNYVKARKPHKCDECFRQIVIGERYLYTFGVYDGRGDSFYICGHCAAVTDWLNRNCGGFLHCGVREDIEEHVSDYPYLRRGLFRYVIGMRNRWQRFDRAGLMPLPRMAGEITVRE